MTSRVQIILDKLDKVRSTGKNKWIACCSSHKDKTPSLSITELDNGQVLIHCYAGCSPESIVASLGVSLADLYPDNKLPYIPTYHKKNSKMTVDQWVIELAKADRKAGKKITEKDKEREIEAFYNARHRRTGR